MFSLTVEPDTHQLYRQVLDVDGKVPVNLAENYGALIVPSGGFAQVGFDILFIQRYKPLFSQV
jgi:hypothetical protein